MFLEALEPRTLLASDFGDAPDSGLGTGTGNHQTLLANNGPIHIITTTQNTLFLGARVDGEDDATQSTGANGDDVTTFPDDEDGLVEPAQDLVLTVGSVPTVRLRASNTTDTAATLYGWIDINRDGVFDNATERTSVTVPTATTKGTFTLTFPTIPVSTTAGATYARFRLSADPLAANSTGEAVGGEVEDYAATITKRSDGSVESAKTKKIASSTNGGPTLAGSDFFGSSVASLGDLDGDGVTDLAVGAKFDDTNGTDGANSNRGAVYVLLMKADGTVKSSVKIASDTNGGPTLADTDFFGSSVASLSDLDGDGVTDLAVGANGDDTGGDPYNLYAKVFRGAVYVLLLNASGTVKSNVKIADGTSGGPTLADFDLFGSSVASLGDLDGDGVTDLAVGARFDGTGGLAGGAVHVMFLKPQLSNLPPSFDHLGNQSAADENPNTHGPALQQTVPGWAFDILVGPAAESDQQPTFVVGNNNHDLFMAQPAIDASGTLTYTPKPNAHGTAIITVVLQDDGGGSDASPQVSFNIVISKTHRLHNALDVGARNGLDVTGSTSTQPDGFIVAGDVITVINYINAKGSGHIPESGPSGPPYCDVNFDDEVVAEDVLKIINYINSHPGQSEAEAESPDSYFDALTGASQATPANSTSGALADVFVLLATDIASSQAKRRRLSAS